MVAHVDVVVWYEHSEWNLRGGGGGSKANFFGESDLSFGHHSSRLVIICVSWPSNTWKKFQSKILIFGRVMAQYGLF